MNRGSSKRACTVENTGWWSPESWRRVSQSRGPEKRSVRRPMWLAIAMSTWPWLLVLLVVNTLLAIPVGAEQSSVEAPVASPTAEELLAAGDQLVEEKNYDEALLRYKEAYELIVPQLRTLPFREPVAPRLMVRSELKDYMAAELAKEVPPPLMKRMDRSLKVLGLVPETLDVRETLLNLLTEEVGGFYNPRTKEMFLIREDPVKRTFLSRLLKGPEFNAEEQRVTLAHEMTHALADQHFDLVGLDRATGGNDDMAIAISSLVEGEATSGHDGGNVWYPVRSGIAGRTCSPNGLMPPFA
jgi:hypothetical protein